MGTSKATRRAAEQARYDAIEAIRELIGDRPTPEIYVSVRHINRLGDARVIACYLPYQRTDGGYGIWHISHRVATALGLRYSDRHEGVTVSGGGMDMGFHLVSSLSRALTGNDYAIGHRWL